MIHNFYNTLAKAEIAFAQSAYEGYRKSAFSGKNMEELYKSVIDNSKIAFEIGRAKEMSPIELVRSIRNYDLHKLKIIPNLKTKKDLETLLHQTVSINHSEFIRNEFKKDGLLSLYFDIDELGSNRLRTFSEVLIWSLKNLIGKIDILEFPDSWN